jgi:vacuolar-type H+-ATPase subunit H
MKKIVEEIIKKEQEASKKVRDARQHAQDLVEDARRDSQGILAKNLIEIKKLTEESKKETAQKFLQYNENSLNKTYQECDALRSAWQKQVPSISRTIFLRVVDIRD